MNRLGLVVGALWLSTACGPLPDAARAKEARRASCDYRVTLAESSPLVLEVHASCSGGGWTAFAINEAEAATHVSRVRDGLGRPLTATGAAFRLPDPDRGEIRYRIDLDAVARDADSFDVALRVGRSLVAPASTWLLRPEPHQGATAINVRVETPAGVQFATGLRGAAGSYQLYAHELSVATYAVFGTFDRHRVSVPGPFAHEGTTAVADSNVEVVVMDGPIGVNAHDIAAWVKDSAEAVATFWRGFPVPKALVVVVPAPRGDGIVFGKVLPESAPGIVVVAGKGTDKGALYRDWILVHELFHLGFPSFSGEGKWLDEGLATYYEPIIRARAGLKTEEAVWEEFIRAMPQGLPAMTGPGLDRASRYREIYWGGAIVCLLADIHVRRATRGDKGLEDGLVELLRAGGHASEVWPFAKAMDTSDGALGMTVLADLSRKYGARGSPVDLPAVFRELGVERISGGVRLHDDAPLAQVRRSIVAGGRR